MSAALTLALTQSRAYRFSSHRVGRLCRMVADRTPDATGVAFIGAPATMAEYGWSASTHWRAVRDAVAAGLLERVATGGGRGLANGYRLLVAFVPRRRRNRVTPAPPTERSSPRSGSRRDSSRGGRPHDALPRPPQPYDRPWRAVAAPAGPVVDLGEAVSALRRARGWLRRG